MVIYLDIFGSRVFLGQNLGQSGFKFFFFDFLGQKFKPALGIQTDAFR